MSKNRKKSFVPNKKYNPVVLAHKITELNKKIEKNKQLEDQRYQSLESFVILLINFASHDIKNAVHNMDGILNNADEENKIDSDTLKVCVKTIRSTLEEFKNLGEGKILEDFELSKLLKSLELLHRAHFATYKIDFKVIWNDTPRNITIYQNFHNILQIFNNLIINSEWAVEETEIKNINLEVKLHDNNIIFTISDTGKGIPLGNIDKVFLPYFSTKLNGTGVGLSHAKHVLTDIQGKIELLSDPHENFNTTFKVTFPLKNEARNSNN